MSSPRSSKGSVKIPLGEPSTNTVYAGRGGERGTCVHSASAPVATAAAAAAARIGHGRNRHRRGSHRPQGIDIRRGTFFGFFRFSASNDGRNRARLSQHHRSVVPVRPARATQATLLRAGPKGPSGRPPKHCFSVDPNRLPRPDARPTSQSWLRRSSLAHDSSKCSTSTPSSSSFKILCAFSRRRCLRR